MNHSFNIEVAKVAGVDEAIILENLLFWIQHNKANNKNFYDGKYWTFNSTKAFTTLFPYWSAKQIRRILKSLEDNEYIITGNFNQKGYDQTKWYTLTEKAYNLYDLENKVMENTCEPSNNHIFPNGQMELTKWANGVDQMGKPIPYINTDINEDVNIKKEKEKNTVAKDTASNKKATNKKDKTEIDNLIISYTNNDNLIENLRGFIKARAAMKKPITTLGFKKLLNKLDKISNTDTEKIEILDNSIMSGWTSIYPLNKSNNNDSRPTAINKNNNISQREYSAEYMDNLESQLLNWNK